MSLSAGNPMRVVLLSVLLFEFLVFALAIPVMILISEVPPGPAAGFGGGAALLALVAAGTMRKPSGYPLGWLTQVIAIALGLLTSIMFVIGIMFAAIWVTSFILGRRLDQANPSTQAS